MCNGSPKLDLRSQIFWKVSLVCPDNGKLDQRLPLFEFRGLVQSNRRIV
jgi:hypothetical protein